MLVVDGTPKDPRPPSQIEQERVLREFPDYAITRLGTSTGGYDKDVAPIPPAAPTPATAPAPAGAAAPKAPEAPANAVDKLWPADTVPIFMPACVGYQPKLVVPCNCVIGKLMLAMPHDEFLKLTANGTIEQDIRLKNIRVECAVKAAAKQ